jgi:hypothetical protein
MNGTSAISETEISLRIHGPANAPTLVYLPGTHGDWTLAASFRARVLPQARFVELSYPRTTTWSLEEYALAIASALDKAGITSGWLLSESWSSQPAWILADRSRRGDGFRAEGLILAGGFARHPWPWAVSLTQRRMAILPVRRLKSFLNLYPIYARWRLRHSPETLAELREFLARRTGPDQQAMAHRLKLIHENDLRPLARACRQPVFCLSGGVDPVVPWPWVFRWMKRECPGYRGSRVIWSGDHNVLNSRAAAAQVLAWMKSA